ncbi:MAG: acyltransferase [Burkholderia sp.]
MNVSRPESMPALTGLRVLLAIWVITRHVFHVYDGEAFFPLGHGCVLFDKGYLGGDGFFILSGFILAHNYAGCDVGYRQCLAARFARVYPVHLVCLLALLAILLLRPMLKHQVLVGVGMHSIPDLLRNLLLLQAWRLRPSASWNDVAWSVSDEWFAYLLFPLFVALARVRNRAQMLILLVLPSRS